MNPKFWLTVGFLMSRIGLFEAAGQCHQKEYSIYGMSLRGHVFKTCKVGFPGECHIKCHEEVTCQSFNYNMGQNVCELNNRTEEARPEDYMPDQTRFYVKRIINRVPLGSIQELPAETCSEIKASEGNEMVNGDYWIYSDGNGQAILARCEENWQKINTEPVCFGARDNNYGAFNITKSGHIKTMKLVRKSGSIKCNQYYSESYWGCTNQAHYGNDGLITIITNTNNDPVLPPIEELRGAINDCGDSKFVYDLDGTGHASPELVYRDLPKYLSVSRNQELQIWYGQDWVGCSESDNTGQTCVDVYAWYVY